MPSLENWVHLWKWVKVMVYSFTRTREIYLNLRGGVRGLLATVGNWPMEYTLFLASDCSKNLVFCALSNWTKVGADPLKRFSLRWQVVARKSSILSTYAGLGET